LNGLLIIDKPAGITSHDVVHKVRRIVGEQQVGHLGTLDPMATGVLPLLLGKWTRLAQFFGKLEKSYSGSIRFGFATDTYDAEGEMVGEHVPVVLDSDEILRMAETYVGTIEQTPPIYSAKKVQGKAAYALARAGKSPVMRAVPVTIHRLTIPRVHGECADFEVTLSAGGYVRSLAHDFGERLGCGAHLASLRRTSAGPFTIEQASTLDKLAKLVNSGEFIASMPHPRTLLPELPATTADTHTATRIRNGNAANLPEFSNAELVKIFAGRDELLGIGKRIAGTLFQPFVVLG
jgi:tRNA pseudouridine55 synthase